MLIDIPDISTSTAQCSQPHPPTPAISDDPGLLSTFSAHARKVTSSSKGKQRATSSHTPSPTPSNPPISAASSSSRITPTSLASSSRKCSHDVSECASGILGDKNEGLLDILREGLASQDESKRLRYNTVITARELRAREARDKREHDLHLLMVQQIHEELLVARNLETLKLQKDIEELNFKRVQAATNAMIRCDSAHDSANGMDLLKD
ncbi:hypothetical protein EV363DRAFT_1454604 [Boletus edulis]|nr:hypothetical protein EV363DRAFT_1454604 [Boletus edulis]